MRIKGWKKTVDDEYIATGGGFNYYITFYRNTINPRKQIEIFVDINRNKTRGPVGLNIGTLHPGSMDKYDFIQGDYNKIVKGGFKDLVAAKRFARKYMITHPRG